MKLYYDEILKSCTVSGSEQAQHPIINLQDAFLVRTWRPSTLVAESALFDAGMGKKINIDSVLIVAHNLTAGSTVTLEMNDTNVWSAPSVDETFSYDVGIMLLYLGMQSYRYLRITFDDATNPDGYIEIGRVFACKRLDLKTPNEGTEYGYEDSTVVSESETAQTYADIGILRRFYNIPIGPQISTTDRDALLTMYSAIKQYGPLIVEVDELQHDWFPLVYMRLNNNLKFKHEGNEYWSLSDPLSTIEVF